MYVIKNVFDNIIGTLLNISRKMKDGLKSRNDLVQFGLKPELHPKLRPNEKNILSMLAWGVSTHNFLTQHQQTSLNERLVYIRLQFSRLSCDDGDFSRNHNKGD
jgi:hypothetical protein